MSQAYRAIADAYIAALNPVAVDLNGYVDQRIQVELPRGLSKAQINTVALQVAKEIVEDPRTRRLLASHVVLLLK